MKRKLLVITGFAIVLGSVTVIYFSRLTGPIELRQLIETRQCQGCDLRSANLKNLDLRGVNLQKANLERADLEGAKLKNANLRQVNLNQANLNRADLGCTNLSVKLRANEQNTNIGFNMETVPSMVSAESSVVDLTLNANEKGATLNFNLQGCADLQSALLKGTRMPDGSIHP